MKDDYISRQDAIDAIPETRMDIFENCGAKMKGKWDG